MKVSNCPTLASASPVVPIDDVLRLESDLASSHVGGAGCDDRD
ncbi:MAG: hypothetical protein WBD31_21060 [Rubripirellula sp.]